MRAKTTCQLTAPTFTVGDRLWVVRRGSMGTHRSKAWVTPSDVVHRLSEDTYCIKVGPGKERHDSQLRARQLDIRGEYVSLD